MNEEPTKNETTDWAARLVDRALRETLGGETPPDLTEAILTAAEEQLPSPRTAEMDAPNANTRRRRWKPWIVAASLLILAGLAVTLTTENARITARNDAGGVPKDNMQLLVKPQLMSSTTGGKNKRQAIAEAATEFREVKRVAAELRESQIKAEKLGRTNGRESWGEGQAAREPSAKPAPATAVPDYYYFSDADRGGDTWGFGSRRVKYNRTALPAAQREWPLGWRGERSFGAHRVFDFKEGRGPGAGGDRYDAIHENPFIAARGEEAVSTFSIDVDTASYTNVRQYLNAGQLPPPDAVRLEELINYFDYDYNQHAVASPARAFTDHAASPHEAPFAAHVEVAACPWKPDHKLARIGVQGREIKAEKRPLTNLVFLIDVSGSMNHPAKHPLVIEGLKALTKELGENDRVAIVVYASQEGLALPSVSGSEQETILAALDDLRAGGSTAGGAGIRLAYQMAEDHFIEGGVNRVILCTDGDFNVGTTSTAELERLVAKKAKQTGVFLSVCGFGRGNLNDAMMETITNQGNGNYYYVDSLQEAEKVFVKGLTGTLVTIAKDVKIQVEFNPAKVAGYRLLGYENRMLRTQDFNDDQKDAGEIGAGHTVTALYEIVPAGKEVPAPAVDDLKYQRPAEPAPQASDDLFTLKMRYKQPDEDKSSKLEWPVADSDQKFTEASVDFQFAAAVASFGMQLRGSQHAGDGTLDAVLEIAAAAEGEDASGYRAEFVELVKKARALREK